MVKLKLTDRHLVIRCESCLFYSETELKKASDTLDFVHEVLVVECEYFQGMECKILEGSMLDEFYKLE